MSVSRAGTRGRSLLLTLALAACSEGAPPQTDVLREILPNGASLIRYSTLAASPVAELTIDLEIGTLDGEPYEIFADIRGIEATADGSIYILDYQASEVRAFDSDGVFQRLLATPGEGPGELTKANGMQLDGQGTLWIQDHGKGQMIGVDAEGTEVARYPMRVMNYGFMWNGVLDARGRLWKPTSHSDEERVSPPQTGLREGRARSYWNYYDRESEVVDSLFMGELTYKTFVSKTARGHSYVGIPFSPRATTIVDPEGGFWATSAESYRVVRLDENADTVLVIEAALEPIPVTDEDRATYVEESLARDPDGLRSAEQIVKLAPATRPMLDQLFLDDLRRLWVRRVSAKGDSPTYDVFDLEGAYLGSVHLAFSPHRYFVPRVRDGQFYTFVLDELDVPRVVRGRVPALGG